MTDYTELKERIERLEDRLSNGIKYDKNRNLYYLVWTEKEINEAKLEAKEIMKALHFDDDPHENISEYN